MQSLALFFSARGRLAPRAFAASAAAVYGTAFLSQLLISAPVMLHAGLAPFALVQAIATWSWFCLHAKRLRDADRGIGVAVAIAVLYALAGIPFLPLLALFLPPRHAPPPGRARAAGERGHFSRFFLAVGVGVGRSRALRLGGGGVFRARCRPRADGDRALDLGRAAPRRDERGPPVKPRCVAPDHNSANRTGWRCISPMDRT